MCVHSARLPAGFSGPAAGVSAHRAMNQRLVLLTGWSACLPEQPRSNDIGPSALPGLPIVRQMQRHLSLRQCGPP